LFFAIGGQHQNCAAGDKEQNAPKSDIIVLNQCPPFFKIFRTKYGAVFSLILKTPQRRLWPQSFK